ncbi:D-alanyl-D-alanine carboxypeptidase [Streptomyces sp. NPDC088794]|uniref:D-alanyl-D-alanine carboxypeptidase n=1 Tax=Streptomyces sp. NPDC088794 TaxID=3365902 RepID=UPI003809C331
MDTATRVFSVRDLATDAEPDAGAEAEADAKPDAEAEARPAGSAEADESAEDTKGAEGAEGGESGGGTAGGEGASDDGTSQASDDSERAEDSEGSAGPGDADGTGDESEAPEDAIGGADGEESAAEVDGVVVDDEPADVPVDAVPADADEPEDAPVDAGVRDEAPEPADAVVVDDESADAPVDAAPADTARTEPEDAPVDAARADAAEPEDAPVDADVSDKAPEPADAVVVDDESADAPVDAAPADTARTEPEDAPVDATQADAAEPEDAPVDAGKAADVEDAPEGGGGGDGVADEPVGDQHTTMLKRPQVDQPTTMLKLGDFRAPKASDAARTSDVPKSADVPKPADAPKSAGAAKAEQPSTAPAAKAPAAKAPEQEAERTSRFVALRPLDEPPVRKPADATAAIPQVSPERTTQQPLPPKPPLDLLAELTNTPPPPQTPVRTFVRRVKIWTPLVLLLAVVFAIVQAMRPLPTPSLQLTADDSYTFDGSKADLPWPSEGQGSLDINGIGTMGAFGKQTPVAIGSVAKAMTAYIVLKDHPLKAGAEGEKITVDALAEKEGGYDKDGESTLNTVKQGDILTERQALSAIMIPSANNIARLLARWDAGSEAAFIKKMNDTAKELGMTNTTYTDASGLKETTVSSAADQVKLGNELVKIPALMEITKLPSWKDPSGKTWNNYNRLVPYNGALGIKTGTTTKAGGNLLFAATKEVGGETVTVVGAILGQHTAPIIDTVNAVSKTAMLAAQDALTSAKILKKDTVVGYVDDGLGGHTPVVLTKDVTAVGWAGLEVKLSFAADEVPHTAKAGTKVGTLTVGDGSGGAVKVPVALQSDLTEPGFTSKLTRIG